ncbi:MAG: hypothetical protein OER77_09155, partial [Myxococcales bacterium]|nr:hypothetical protein [Myxococcales bacterium]
RGGLSRVPLWQRVPQIQRIRSSLALERGQGPVDDAFRDQVSVEDDDFGENMIPCVFPGFLNDPGHSVYVGDIVFSSGNIDEGTLRRILNHEV